MSQNVASSSVSGTSLNVVFDPAKLIYSGSYEFFCTLSNGLTFSNIFSI